MNELEIKYLADAERISLMNDFKGISANDIKFFLETYVGISRIKDDNFRDFVTSIKANRNISAYYNVSSSFRSSLYIFKAKYFDTYIFSRYFNFKDNDEFIDFIAHKDDPKNAAIILDVEFMQGVHNYGSSIGNFLGNQTFALNAFTEEQHDPKFLSNQRIDYLTRMNSADPDLTNYEILLAYLINHMDFDKYEFDIDVDDLWNKISGQ